MTRILIDSNSLISFVTDRNIRQREIVAGYFEDAASLKHELTIVTNVIIEFVYTLEKIYQVGASQIQEMLAALLDTPGMRLDSDYDLDFVLKLWPAIVKDFRDAMVASRAMKGNLSVLSFDRKFRKQLRNFGVQIEKI